MRRIRRLSPAFAALLALCLCLALFEGRVHPLSHLAVHAASTGIGDAVEDGPQHAEDLLCLDCVAAAATADVLSTPAAGLPVAAGGGTLAGRLWRNAARRTRERQRNRSPPRF
ncbi:hypothetical protein [Denitromonas iodatirespirans]|uniref:DUF2946 domain-containing protein n=1 Tax=Denitromonas iodatirespirans TaxID=2795389 RepID=A0A944DJE5_DENI1|nr:hypothetical protein [Denitromonas iodatirespirans]MBT0959929.1 hypothetical protein [Denitromonas iodatirespirans]